MSREDRWRFTFRVTPRLRRNTGTDYHYEVIGAKGGMHLHITDFGDDNPYVSERYSGGLEVHYRSPPDYMTDRPPSHDVCWLLKCPCWHDGTSLYVSEVLIPKWVGKAFDMDYMSSLMFVEADDRFGYNDDVEVQLYE